ncbi:MAG: glycosyltransferase family 4 protein [Candidatus Hodarchaeota archaeon]
MHVLIIAQYFPPDLGGAATRAYNAAKGLIMNGCKVTVVTTFPHYPNGEIPLEYRWYPIRLEWIDGIRVIRTFIFPLQSKGLARRIILFCTFISSSLFAFPLIEKIDVIWATNPDIVSMIPAIIYHILKKKAIFSNVDDLILQDLYDLNLIVEHSLISKVAELFTRLLYSKAKAITPVSPGYIGYISQRYFVGTKKIHVVRGGVDPTIFAPISIKKNCKRFLVIYSGSFSIAYDFDQVIKAAQIMEKKGLFDFILQGKGELIDHVKFKIKNLKLKNVCVLEKVLSRKEVAELLNKADALILPLREFGKPYRGLSSKIYEYQASGKPIICCARGQPAIHVEKTNSGFVVIPGDFKKIADMILFLNENPEIARDMGRHGKKYVETNVSIKAIGYKLKKIFSNFG